MSHNNRILCVSYGGEPRFTQPLKAGLRSSGYVLVDTTEAQLKRTEGPFVLVIVFGLGEEKFAIPGVEELRGISFLQYVRSVFPQSQVVCVTGHEDIEVIKKITRTGANYFFRSAPAIDLIRKVAYLAERKTAPSN